MLFPLKVQGIARGGRVVFTVRLLEGVAMRTCCGSRQQGDREDSQGGEEVLKEILDGEISMGSKKRFLWLRWRIFGGLFLEDSKKALEII